MSDTIENRIFEEIAVGDSASLSRTLRPDDVALFAAITGDDNPLHLDADFAAQGPFRHVIGHGMWTGALISAVLGTELPGPGTIYLGQDLSFRHPVAPGDVVTATVTVTAKHAGRRLTLACRCVNARGEEVATGTAEVIAPAEKVVVVRPPAPVVQIQRHARFAAAMEEARKAPRLPIAVVHPCSPDAITAAIEARDAGLVDPVLVGPEHKIRAAAEAAGVDIAGLPLEPTEHSHAAAARAVALARSGRVKALMKGSLHTDELLGAVVAADGLRTDRRISHVYAMDVPAYPKPLFVTDAAVNIAPTLEEKRDICQNAVDLLHILGVERPAVAVLSAVETVNPKLVSTVDAAALTVMAARGQIYGARVDGPLAFDNAIDRRAAEVKGIASPVAGDADILLVPDIEAGNMLAKQLIYFAGADAAGLVLGARVPIVLTSRSDSVSVRLASAALAVLVAARRPADPAVAP
jgi:phosphate acetyltransferase